MHALLRRRRGRILNDSILSTSSDGVLAAVMQSLLGPLVDPHRPTSSLGHLVLLSCCERQAARGAMSCTALSRHSCPGLGLRPCRVL